MGKKFAVKDGFYRLSCVIVGQAVKGRNHSFLLSEMGQIFINYIQLYVPDFNLDDYLATDDKRHGVVGQMSQEKGAGTGTIHEPQFVGAGEVPPAQTDIQHSSIWL